jgi:Cdc6-like AAA superfamily ATPase
MSKNDSVYIQDNVINDLEQDTFGHKHIADAVVDSILSTRPPFTIGIFGGWGTGKSSLLELISSNLKDEKVATVTIDAWRYSSAENLRRAFLVHVARELAPNLLNDLRRRLYTSEQETLPEKPSKLDKPKLPSLEYVLDIIKTFLGLVVIFFGFLFVVFAFRTVIVNQGITEFFTKFDWVGFLDKFVDLAFVPFLLTLINYLRLYVIQRPVTVIQERIDADELFSEYFEKVVKEAIKGPLSKKKLVIFVDNLDRLTDDKMVDALESLKTYLINTHCVFIVACDDNVVRTVINNSDRIPKANENHIGNGKAGEHYLDKFFQQTFRLPEFMAIDLTDFAVKNFITTNMYTELHAQNVDVRNLVSIILPSDVNSPRKVKRLLNEFIALYEIVRRRENEKDGKLKSGTLTKNIEFLGKFSTVRAEYPLFYRALTEGTALLNEITESFQQQENEAAQKKLIDWGITYSSSLIAYLRKTQTITVDDIGPYIWLSQDNLTLGLKGNHYSLLRTALSDGDVEQVKNIIENSEDLAYKELLAIVASRTVDQRLIGIEQRNGVKVISNLLPIFDDSIKPEIAHVAAKLIPLWAIDVFSSDEIFNVLHWSRMGGMGTQREKLIARISDRLHDPKLRLSTFHAILENVEVVEQSNATERVNLWLKEILLADNQSVRIIGETTDSSLNSESQSDPNKENRDFAEWLIARASDYKGQVIRRYFSRDLLDYMVGRLLGTFDNLPAVDLDATEGVGLYIQKAFMAIEVEIENGFENENYWNGLIQILINSTHIPEIQYCLEKGDSLVSYCQPIFIERFVDSTFISIRDLVGEPENRNITNDVILTLQRAEKAVISLRQHKGNHFDDKHLGRFTGNLTYLLGVIELRDDIFPFINSFIENFGKEDGIILLTSVVDALSQFGSNQEIGNLLLDTIVRWNDFVSAMHRSSVVEKINKLFISNELSQVEISLHYLMKIIGIEDYKEFIKNFANAWKEMFGPDTPLLLQKKLYVYDQLIVTDLLETDDLVKTIIPQIPFAGNQEQLQIVLEEVEKHQDKISENIGKELFTAIVSALGQFSSLLPRGLKLASRWIDSADDTSRSQFDSQAYQNFTVYSGEIMKTLSVSWKGFTESEIKKHIVQFYSLDFDGEEYKIRANSVAKGLEFISEENRASYIHVIWDELINQDRPAEQFMNTAVEFMPTEGLIKLREEALSIIRENGVSPTSEKNLILLTATIRKDMRNIMPVVDLFVNLFGRGQVDIEMALKYVVPCLKPLDLRADHKYKLAEAMGQAATRTDVKEINDEIHDKAEQLGLMWFSYRKFWK